MTLPELSNIHRHDIFPNVNKDRAVEEPMNGEEHEWRHDYEFLPVFSSYMSLPLSLTTAMEQAEMG